MKNTERGALSSSSWSLDFAKAGPTQQKHKNASESQPE
jgi:hypothetical protein